MSPECVSVHIRTPFSCAHTHACVTAQNCGDYSYGVFKKFKETGRQVDLLFIYRRRVRTQMGEQGQEAFQASAKLLAEGRTQQFCIPAQQLLVKRGMHERTSKFTFDISAQKSFFRIASEMGVSPRL